MVQGGSSLCLTVESFEGLRVFSEVFGQELQGDKAVQLGVLGLVDDTHASAAELFDDAVVRDGLTDERVGLRHSAAILGCNLKQVNELVCLKMGQRRRLTGFLATRYNPPRPPHAAEL
jgi:hypothetical protein